MIHIGHLGMLFEDMNKKLLTIKILERSKSLKKCLYGLVKFQRESEKY